MREDGRSVREQGVRGRREDRKKKTEVYVGVKGRGVHVGRRIDN